MSFQVYKDSFKDLEKILYSTNKSDIKLNGFNSKIIPNSDITLFYVLVSLILLHFLLITYQYDTLWYYEKGLKFEKFQKN